MNSEIYDKTTAFRDKYYHKTGSEENSLDKRFIELHSA
jgi:hypothetical protein